MPNPFDQFDAQSAETSQNPFDQFDRKTKGVESKPDQVWEHLSVLPFDVSKDGQDFRFNSDAGIIGSLKRAFTLPGDVATGKVDPMSPEGIQRASELAAIASPMSAASRAGEGGAIGLRQALADAPTAEALRDAGKAGYQQAREAAVDFYPGAVNDMAASLKSSLNDTGLLKELAPTTHKWLDDLATQQPSGTVAPLSGLVAARQAFARVGRQIDPATRAPTQDAVAAQRVLGVLDEFLQKPSAGSVVSGDAAGAGEALARANANYAAGMRSNQVNGIEDAADLGAAAANSGQNIGNTIRQRVKSLLLNPKQSAGYSPDELAALREVTEGTPVRNTARYVGNLLGGGGGLGAVVTGGVGGAAGGAIGGPFGVLAGAASPLLGVLSKKADNAMTRGALNAADELIRKRSPLFAELQRNAPMIEQYPISRDALVRALLMSGDQTQ